MFVLRLYRKLPSTSLVSAGTHHLVRELGGSWVVISGVISPLIWVIIMVTLLSPHL